MRTLLLVVGLLVTLGGGVWILQGLNVPFAPQSFMTNDRMWIVYGAVAVIVGAALVWWSRSLN